MAQKIEMTVAEVVDHLKITGRFAPACREVLERRVASDAARANGIRISSGRLQAAADAFRVHHGLERATDARKWLKSAGLSLEAFEQYLETNLLIAEFKSHLGRMAQGNRNTPPELNESIKEAAYQCWLSRVGLDRSASGRT